jgi:hypothetical protein
LAVIHSEQIKSMLRDEVKKGWQLILHRDAIHLIPNAVLAPLSIVKQDTINDGTALLCHIHYIIHLQWWHPTARILQMKPDCKAAYKCLRLTMICQIN